MFHDALLFPDAVSASYARYYLQLSIFGERVFFARINNIDTIYDAVKNGNITAGQYWSNQWLCETTQKT